MTRRQEVSRRKMIRGALAALPQPPLMLLPMAPAAAAGGVGVREVVVALTTNRAMVRTTPAEIVETIETAGVAKAAAVVAINRLLQIVIAAALIMGITTTTASLLLSKDRTDSSRSPLYLRATAQAIGPAATTTTSIAHNWSNSSGLSLNCSRLNNYSSCSNSNSSSRSNNNIYSSSSSSIYNSNNNIIKQRIRWLQCTKV